MRQIHKGDQMDLYRTLEVERDATTEEIKAAHRRAAKATHPDLGGSRQAFDQVQRAYGILSDQRRRANYDRTGAETETNPASLQRAQARTVLASIMQSLIARPDTDPATFDLVVGMRQVIIAQQAGMRENIAGAREGMQRTRKFLRRLHRKTTEGEDHLVKLLENQIRMAEEGVAQQLAEIQMLELAKAMAGEYAYKTDPVQPMVHMGFGGSWSGWK